MIITVLKEVRKIEIKTRQLVEGLIQGAYHSVFKGRGIEFSEVKEYIPGDDIRAIDWKVTARMNKPFVKEFIEERDLTLYVVFDVSGSNEFGYKKTKKLLGIELVASLMFAAIRNNDRVGLCLFTDRIEKFVVAKKGRKHVLRLIRELLYFKPESKKTDLNYVLSLLARIIKKSAIIFIVSDFLTGDFYKPLKVLKNKHDIICINIMDVNEYELPDVGYVILEDEESNEQIVINTSNLAVREKYKRYVVKNLEKLKRNLKRVNIDLIQIKTDEPFIAPLRKFFKLREKRIR